MLIKLLTGQFQKFLKSAELKSAKIKILQGTTEYLTKRRVLGCSIQ